MVWVIFGTTVAVSLLGMWLLWRRGEDWRALCRKAQANADGFEELSERWKLCAYRYEELYESANARANNGAEIALRWQSLYESANERADRAQAIAQGGQREDA